MDRQFIINSDKGTFMDFLQNDYKSEILELFDDEGIELLKKYKYTEERITYILCYSKYCNQLLHNDKFLNLFLNTDISYYYASMHSLNNDTYGYIINSCIKLGKDNAFIGKLFSYFNSEYKLATIDNWPYSKDLLYEVFKIDLDICGPRILKKYNIDLMSHNISIERVFNAGKYLFLKEVENRNINNKKTETLYVPSDMITKEIIERLWNNNNIFKYRKIINDASYCSDPTKLNEYAKRKEEETINSCDENGLTKELREIYKLKKKLYDIHEDAYEYEKTKQKLIELLDRAEFYELAIEINRIKIDELEEYLERISSQIISNYIIDYHFEENYYNIMYDMRELLNLYFAGHVNLSEEKVSLYNKIIHIDELPIEDKKELHEELKKHNMMEEFYDDMAYARNIVREAIKDYSLTREEMSKYRDDELSDKYGVDVYAIEDNPFFVIVKSRRATQDRFPTGHSYSLVGNGCIGTFDDPSDSTTFVYDSDDLNSEQIVHIYPMDSFTLYKPFSYSGEATRRVQSLIMPEELLKETNGYNELLLLEQGREKTDMNKRIPELQKMALFCLDKITEKDIKMAQVNDVGIFLVDSKKYHMGYDDIQKPNNINNDYWNKNYFDGISDLNKHKRNR